ILMKKLGEPVIATSGNLSEEPVCIDNTDALNRLKQLADFFLVHDRPVVRQVDDSIVQVIGEDVSIIRRSRGYAPLPVDIGLDTNKIIAVGAHLKNAFAIGLEDGVVVSQHIGDLDNEISRKVFEREIASLESIYDSPKKQIICDKHPDYASSQYAHTRNMEVLEVQHHHAHIASCMAEHHITDDVLGVCFDGTGFGDDGTIWGGEFLKIKEGQYTRFAHLRTFALAGGEIAIKEPRRAALGVLYELGQGQWAGFSDLPCIKEFSVSELAVLKKMIEQKINTPLTSSMGRFFDAVSSIIGLCHQNSFEGQAAMCLEFEARPYLDLPPYCYRIVSEQEGLVIDWLPMLEGIIKDFRDPQTLSTVSTRFHRTLVEIIVEVARLSSQSKIVFSGGCFQNKFLIERAIERLGQEGFCPYWHKQVATNDGGIALGQISIAARRMKNVSCDSRQN
ncbi:MAG: carbamoyltransferase HypF, partial [Candidatus Omnitrophica bacterium]|nr:carbamoyltransferase HypF [Candidatus Omnitrophota bacterium]